MILQDFQKNQVRQTIMSNHRHNYNKIKAQVTQNKFDQIDYFEVNKEKDLVIQHLHNCDNEDMIEQFQELSFYQEKYLVLCKFLNAKNQKGLANIDQNQVKKVVEIFQQHFDANKEEDGFDYKKMKKTDSLELNQKLQKLPLFNNNFHKVSNVGLGSALFDFFEQKQREAKAVGFKDLIEKKTNTSTSSKPFIKKTKQPSHDLQIKKLLEENKRLHLQLEKRSKQDVQLNQYEKNVLRQQKQRCMKRIQQLQQQVQELSRNNYKLQQIERSRKAVSTFVNQDSINNNSKNQLLPYYIKPRHNDLKFITQKNNVAKMQNAAEHQLLDLVNNIPPIEKKQQYSFDDDIPIQNQYRTQQPDNILLSGLLEDNDEIPPQRQLYSGSKQVNQPRRSIFSGSKQIVPPKKDLFYGGQQVSYNNKNRLMQSNKQRQNETINNGNRFDSFSLANTAYNNSSLFLNASKNQIAIDSTTSTRNKVAFFKQSLIIFRDSNFEIAYKRSNLSPEYNQLRLIFYINNKTGYNEPVHLEYDFQTTYYNLRVTERAHTVGPQSQTREVLEIGLAQQCSDLNSVIDVHVGIGNRKFDLWVPACFIQWGGQEAVEPNGGFMTVQPDRQFASYGNMAKILPLSRMIKSSADESQAYLLGRSKFGNHEIKFTWWQKQLTIDANSKILDFLAFVMHHFK